MLGCTVNREKTCPTVSFCEVPRLLLAVFICSEVLIQRSGKKVLCLVRTWAILMNEGSIAIVKLLQVPLWRCMQVHNASHGLDDGFIGRFQGHVIVEED